MNIKADTIARTIVLALALINQLLAVAGKEVLPFTNDDIYQIVSLAATFITSGIIENRWPETKAALEANGFEVLSHKSEEEWHCFVCR